MKYTSKQLTDGTFPIIVANIKSLLVDLGNMEVEDLTTFELSFLRKFADNPPTKGYGCEKKILS